MITSSYIFSHQQTLPFYFVNYMACPATFKITYTHSWMFRKTPKRATVPRHLSVLQLATCRRHISEKCTALVPIISFSSRDRFMVGIYGILIFVTQKAAVEQEQKEKPWVSSHSDCCFFIARSDSNDFRWFDELFSQSLWKSGNADLNFGPWWRRQNDNTLPIASRRNSHHNSKFVIKRLVT